MTEFQLFFLETTQQLRCSPSVNQPNFFLILSQDFPVILPCSSLNKSSLLLVFTPSSYSSLPQWSSTAHSPLPSPFFFVPLWDQSCAWGCYRGTVPFLVCISSHVILCYLLSGLKTHCFAGWCPLEGGFAACCCFPLVPVAGPSLSLH